MRFSAMRLSLRLLQDLWMRSSSLDRKKGPLEKSFSSDLRKKISLERMNVCLPQRKVFLLKKASLSWKRIFPYFLILP